MTALIIVGAIVLFFSGILLLPVSVTLTLRESLDVKLGLLGLRYRLYPQKKKVKAKDYSLKSLKKQAKKQQKRQKHQKEHAAPDAPAQKAPLTERLATLRVLLSALFQKTGKHLKLKTARLHIRVATGDAAKTALLYGAASGALASTLAVLDRFTKLRPGKKHSVSLVADYLAEKPSADVKIVFSMNLLGGLSTLFSMVFAYLRHKHRKKSAQKKKSRTAEHIKQA